MQPAPHGYLGIDLTGTPKRASTCAYLDPALGAAELADLATDDELVAYATSRRPVLIAIDAPLGFPTGWQCLDAVCTCGRCADPTADLRRACEVELRQRGIACYWTTRKSIIRGMIYRALALVPRLAAASGAEVLEVYPFGAKVRLFGRPLPRKSTPEGANWYDARTRALLPAIAGHARPLVHDDVDALLAAYTAALHARGATEVLGLPAEGQIVLPTSATPPAC